MSESTLFFTHADDFALFENWDNASKTSGQPMLVSELVGVDDFYDDMHDVQPFENPQSALTHYLNNSEVLALASGETLTDRIWCLYRGYVWLFAVIEASAPYDSTDNDYTFVTRCHWQGQWVDRIDKLLDEES